MQWKMISSLDMTSAVYKWQRVINFWVLLWCCSWTGAYKWQHAVGFTFRNAVMYSTDTFIMIINKAIQKYIAKHKQKWDHISERVTQKRAVWWLHWGCLGLDICQDKRILLHTDVWRTASYWKLNGGITSTALTWAARSHYSEEEKTILRSHGFQFNWNVLSACFYSNQSQSNLNKTVSGN